MSPAGATSRDVIPDCEESVTSYCRPVLTLDDVARLALALPEVIESDRRGSRTWAVAGKVFAWERPYTKADLKRIGDQPHPSEPLLAVRVADLHEKEALLAEGRPGIFTMPHFDGYAAVLVELKAARKPDVRDLLTDGWLARAEPALAAGFVWPR
jgi:hypothetical protein